MFKQSSKDRTNLCHFVFADGRRYTMPESGEDMGLCYFHAQKYVDGMNKKKAGEQISQFLTTGVNTACDMNSALVKLFCATAQGHIKPKTCATLAYLAQLILKTNLLAKEEYLSAYKVKWFKVVQDSICFQEESEEDAPPAVVPSGSDSSLAPDQQEHSSQLDEVSGAVPAPDQLDEDGLPVTSRVQPAHSPEALDLSPEQPSILRFPQKELPLAKEPEETDSHQELDEVREGLPRESSAGETIEQEDQVETASAQVETVDQTREEAVSATAASVAPTNPDNSRPARRHSSPTPPLNAAELQQLLRLLYAKKRKSAHTNSV